MRLALTGATGGVGRALVEEARRRGATVRALVRDLSRARALEALGVELVRGDLGSKDALAELVRDRTVVVHAAAHVGDWGERDAFARVNVDGTRNVLTAAADARVKRFVQVSSVAVYGRPPRGTIDETYAPHHVETPYEATKLEAERLAFRLGRERGVEVAAVRPTLIFGAHDRVFMPRVVRQLRQRTALLVGGGRAPLTVVDVRDVVDVVLRCAERDEAVFEAFNVSASPTPTVREVVDAIAGGSGAPRARISVPRAPAMLVARALEAAWRLRRSEMPPPITPSVVRMLTLDVVYDASKARRLLGWSGGAPPLDALRRLARAHAGQPAFDA